MVENLYAETGDAAHETATQSNVSADFPLGIEGFTYGDLYRPARLRALAEAFYAEVARADAPLGASLAEYVGTRGENLEDARGVGAFDCFCGASFALRRAALSDRGRARASGRRDSRARPCLSVQDLRP